MARLAERVEAWVPADTPQSFLEAPAFPGLTLVVRIVATASPTTNDGYSVLVDIPAIPELPGPPDPNAGNFQELRSAYIAQQELVRRQRTRAHSEATNGAKRLREFPLQEEESGVTACASVLALMVADVAKGIMPKPTDVAFQVASDLEDNKELQLRGSFDGAPLTILQTCPGGNLDRCQERRDTFSASMKSLNVGSIAVYRSELSARTIDLWLEPAS